MVNVSITVVSRFLFFFVFLFSYIRKKIVGRKIKKARGKFKRKYLIVKVVVKLLSLSFNKF